jgi:DNA-binding CsgD family transcriptional regulator
VNRKFARDYAGSAPQELVGTEQERKPDTEHVLAAASKVRLQARAIRSRSRSLRGRFTSPRTPLPRLSTREREVLALLASGLTTKDLAIQLGISVNTANYHLANVYRKLGAHSRVAAANLYFGRDGAARTGLP